MNEAKCAGIYNARLIWARFCVALTSKIALNQIIGHDWSEIFHNGCKIHATGQFTIAGVLKARALLSMTLMVGHFHP